MNIIQVFQRFPTQEDCIAHLEKARWNGMPACPYCGSINTARNQHRHRCYDCKTSFSVTVGTIFHHTHMPLQKWFLAITLILNAKKGLSALQLSCDLEVNKNTAWRIAMQIRKAMTQAQHRNLLTGIVEMDETYVGGKPRKGSKGDGPNGQHTRGRGTKKAPVIGAVERDGKVLPHSVIKHAKWYVDGDIHTNTIESFWALLKRAMFGQFHSVSRKHLQKYVDEFCYRYNLRNDEPSLAFDLTINRGLGMSI